MRTCLNPVVERARVDHGLQVEDIVALLSSWPTGSSTLAPGGGRRVVLPDGAWVEAGFSMKGNLKTEFSDPRMPGQFADYVRRAHEVCEERVHHLVLMCDGAVSGSYLGEGFRLGPADGPQVDERFQADVPGLPRQLLPTPLRVQLRISTPPASHAPFYRSVIVERALRRLSGFLAVHLNPFVRPPAVGVTWATGVTASGVPNRLVSQGYVYGDGETETWVECPPRLLEEIAPVRDGDYFEALRTELAVPSDLGERWERLSLLAADDRLRFERASSWVLRALDSRAQDDPTAVVISAVVAIECVLDKTGERCEQCGQQAHSVAREFNAFVDRYVGTEEPQLSALFKNVYARRSWLIHGSGLHSVDESLFTTLGADAFIDQLSALILARRGLRNWLADQRPGVDAR